MSRGRLLLVLLCSVPAAVLALIGSLSMPRVALLGWLSIGVAVGSICWVLARENPASALVRLWGGQRLASVRAGVLATVVSVCVPGMVVVFGPTMTVLVLVLCALAGGGAILLHRRQRRIPAVAERTMVLDDMADPAPAVSVPLGALDTLSVDELCLAWRRSYLRLDTTVSGAVWQRLTANRAQLLDEMEKRDPSGFARWIASGARAAGDPGRYLGAR